MQSLSYITQVQIINAVGFVVASMGISLSTQYPNLTNSEASAIDTCHQKEIHETSLNQFSKFIHQLSSNFLSPSLHKLHAKYGKKYDQDI